MKTETLMATLPPTDERVATGSDIDGLRGDMATFRLELRGDMDNLRGEMAEFRLEMRQDRREFRDEMRQDRAEMRKDLKDFKAEMKGLFAAARDEMILQNELTRSDLTAQFRGELTKAVTGQTRAVIASSATAVARIGGLAVTLARFL